MKKVTGMAMAIVAVLVLASAAFAWRDDPGIGYGPGYYSGSNGLQDELAAKQINLQAEYDKPVPDTARIASLKNDIIDLQAKIQVVADKQGTPTGGPGYGHGRMMGHSMMGGWNCCW